MNTLGSGGSWERGDDENNNVGQTDILAEHKMEGGRGNVQVEALKMVR